MAASSSTSRAAFAQQVADVLDRHGLDGVDLDWESPANEEQDKLYALLIEETKNRLGPDKLVTFTIHHFQDFGERAYRSADRVHYMTYDMVREISLVLHSFPSPSSVLTMRARR